MSREYIFICDKCKSRSGVVQDGCSWRPPKGWLEISSAESVGRHVCPSCQKLNSMTPNKKWWWKL